LFGGESFCPTGTSYVTSAIWEVKMLYTKNLPFWERFVRLTAGLAMAVCATRYWGTIVGYTWAIGGTFVALTSFVGFCPMCSLAGRRPIVRDK
jgi:hypothetical protein